MCREMTHLELPYHPEISLTLLATMLNVFEAAHSPAAHACHIMVI